MTIEAEKMKNAVKSKHLFNSSLIAQRMIQISRTTLGHLSTRSNYVCVRESDDHLLFSRSAKIERSTKDKSSKKAPPVQPITEEEESKEIEIVRSQKNYGDGLNYFDIEIIG